MQERDLQQAVHGFIRTFGLLGQGRTPCGQPVPTSQAHALQVLAEAGEITQQELAERLGVDKSTASRLVGQLEERGWAGRQVNPANRREHLLELTPEGTRVGASIAVAAQQRFGSILSQIDPAKRDQVIEALQLLQAAVGKAKEL